MGIGVLLRLLHHAYYMQRADVFVQLAEQKVTGGGKGGL
jgi:hypothetical protein